MYLADEGFLVERGAPRPSSIPVARRGRPALHQKPL